MLITDLLEEINKFKENEIEFYLMDENGNARKLNLFICDGNYIFKHKNKDGNDTDIIVLGLTDATSK